METINYDDFAKLNIVVGTVKKAENVEKSNKLLKLQIDIGKKELIQVLSGISEFYTAKGIVGKQVLVLVNLETRKIMGVQSNGMILAADNNGDAVLIVPEKPVKKGSKIS